MDSTPDLDDPRADPVAGLDAVWESTARLLATAHRIGDDALTGASLCPGWSRAHVLGHLARNAEALGRLCAWARTGEPTPMYPSREARTADIEASAHQPRRRLLEDLAATAERLADDLAGLHEGVWDRKVHIGAGGTGAAIPAARIGWQRLKELEIHHVDLAFGYSPADWPEGFVHRALTQTLRMFARRDDAPSVVVEVGGEPVPLGAPGGPTVAGPPSAVLAWLTGRSAGADLVVDPADAAPPPTLPAWA